MEEATEKQINLLKQWNLPIPRTKEEARIMIGEHIDKMQQEKPPVVKPQGAWSKPSSSNGKYNPTSMYVSYAKDIFCSFGYQGNDESEAEHLMKRSIYLVKQAKESFE